MSEKNIRPNYYRTLVHVRRTDPDSLKEPRASTVVELEAQDLIEALDLNFNEGNVLKYLFRAGRKSPTKLEDMKKVLTYAGFAVEQLESGHGYDSEKK